MEAKALLLDTSPAAPVPPLVLSGGCSKSSLLLETWGLHEHTVVSQYLLSGPPLTGPSSAVSSIAIHTQIRDFVLYRDINKIRVMSSMSTL